MLFSGLASVTIAGIVLWATLVQRAWKAQADIANAPNTLRDGLANGMGAALSKLVDGLNADTEVEPVLVDATPDSLEVEDGHMLFFAQVIVVPLRERLREAWYSCKLRRLVIYQLNGGRRFRTQELARLIKAGKVTVPGLHHVHGRYLRTNPDDKGINNLLRMFKDNETRETVVR